ncbi:MAG: nucleotidyltransferase family protein [Gammaproteobacteria bacterium]|nr:nucleotidyltransferase family protein [Gammaproteobacteria bacterium]
MTDVTGILLAAGTAKRFGSAKLQHTLHNGVPMGVAAAQVLIQAVPDTIAVVRPGDRVLKEAFLAAGLKVVENPRAAEGMSTSLAAGVKAAPGAGGWIIALADMPWIQPATINKLADRLRNGTSMIAPVYRGRRGHPVGFASCWGNRLKTLRGDKGAKDLLTEYCDKLVLLNTDDPGVIEDIDYPDALERYNE